MSDVPQNAVSFFSQNTEYIRIIPQNIDSVANSIKYNKPFTREGNML